MEYFQDKYKNIIIRKKNNGHHLEFMTKEKKKWIEAYFSHPYTRDYYSKEMRILQSISEEEAMQLIHSM